MVSSAYAYALMFCTEDGTVLAQMPVDVDWQPAIEWARLVALREAQALPTGDAHGMTGVAPEWHPSLGEPYVKGFRVALCGGVCAAGFTNAYFAKYAREGSVALVEEGKLKAGDRFLYLVFATPRTEEPGQPSRVRFRAGEQELPSTTSAALAGFLARATPAGVHHADDISVFIPRHVLKELAELYRQKSDAESGGILVGWLHRDHEQREIFLEVTAQIPAAHTEADATRLTFTAETWKAVRTALALRRRGEMWVGWWHTHPVRSWASGSGEDAPEGSTQPLSGSFFSIHDAAVHRAAFVGAHCVALVVSDLGPERETFSLFGWREGAVASRGYHILEDAAPASPEEHVGVGSALVGRSVLTLPGTVAAAGRRARGSSADSREGRVEHE